MHKVIMNRGWALSVVLASLHPATEAAGQSVLFRNSTSGYLDFIPGWDHVAFEVNPTQVWESHPGYGCPGDPANCRFQENEYCFRLPFVPPICGLAYDPDTGLRVPVSGNLTGVFAAHTIGSFRWNSGSSTMPGSPQGPEGFQRLMIPSSLASGMEFAAILRQGAAYPSTASFVLNPFALTAQVQKGLLGTFTCCGLVEYCAEQVPSYKRGQGFIPDVLEELPIRVTLPVVGIRVFSILTPQTLYMAIRDDWDPDDLPRVIRGLFDPVDFIVTDPRGRRVGFTVQTGRLNEIPGMEYTGDGDFEYLTWTRPAPGEYQVQLFGLGANTVVGIGDGTGAGFVYDGFLAQGQTVEGSFVVQPVCLADFNGVDGPTVQDLFDFLTAYFTAQPTADVNESGMVTVQDIFDFLLAYFAGCP